MPSLLSRGGVTNTRALPLSLTLPTHHDTLFLLLALSRSIKLKTVTYLQTEKN